jgi:DDE superfamily endonuclease
LSNTDVRGRGYAPAGKTPVSYAPGGRREKLSMIATVTSQGKARWMVVDDNFNADKLIEFLTALIKDTDTKVFLILDNLRVHHAKTGCLGIRTKSKCFTCPAIALNSIQRNA